MTNRSLRIGIGVAVAVAVAVAVGAAGCSGAKQDGGGAGRGSAPVKVDDLELGGKRERITDIIPADAAGAAGAARADAGAAVAVAGAGSGTGTGPGPGTGTGTGASSAGAEDAADFTAEAKLLFRVAACGGTDPLPDRFDARTVAVIDRHCKWIAERIAAFRETYFEGKGREFFAQLVPADVPKTVVYPFGGGDLLSALVAFPDAEEITTISLELSGDPRRIDTMTPRQLRDSLAALRVEIGGLLSVGSNTSVNLSASQRNELPAQISSFLMGLAAGGYEPVGMRFFRLRDDGSIEYLTTQAIADLETAEAAAAGKRRGAAKRKGDWQSPNFSEAFAHVEIRYVKTGDPAVRIHRHLGWNLADDYLADHGELLRHLDAKGKVTFLTKGASYLLWYSSFSTIRDYMLGHLAWMLSDSTGIPPAFARKANMVQDTYGSFSGAFLEGAEAHAKRHSDDFRALWRKNPRRPLPVRFGYLDLNKRAHLVVTRPAP